MSVVAVPKASRRGLMVVVGLLASIVTFAVGAEIALAHHSVPDGSINCAGVVSWTATAWSGDTSNPTALDKERTNDQVKVWYTVDTKSTKFPLSPALEADRSPNTPADANNPGAPFDGRFRKSNSYGFSNSFSFPTGATYITIFVQEQVNWANGSGPNSAQSTAKLYPPSSCPGTPGVNAGVPTCASPNSNSIAVTFSLAGGTTASSFKLISYQGTASSTTFSLSATTTTTKIVTFTGVPNGTFTLNFTVDKVAQTALVVSNLSCTTVTSTPKVSLACANVNNATVTVAFTANGGTVASSAYSVTSVSSGTAAPLTFALANPGAKSVAVTGVVNGTFTLNYNIDGVVQSALTTNVSCTGVTATASAKATCAAVGNATIVITFTATGGTTASSFVVGTPSSGTADATSFMLAGGAVRTVTVTGAGNGSFTLPYTLDGVAQTPVAASTISCVPGTGTATATSVCENFDGTVTITLTQTGGQFPAIFVVDDVTYTVVAGTPQSVAIKSVVDGTFSKTVTINGTSTTVTAAGIACDPKLSGAPICNEVGVDGTTVTTHWFTLTNPEVVDLPVTWIDGSAMVPAGGSVTVKSGSAHIDIMYGTVTLVGVDQATSTGGNKVTFVKQVLGPPPTGATYTIRVSRLVGDSYAEELTFDLLAGVPKTILIPSTLDGAGISYKVEETVTSGASTHVVSPDSFTLQGNLGQTVSVVVTNGFAAVKIDKEVSATTVKAGDTLRYTLVATNTGGLTLDPVVISDLLPSYLTLSSALVAGGAGDCTLVTATKPQLVSCALTGSLAVGAKTPMITLVTTVDADTPAGTTMLNQAKVLGTYGPGATAPSPELSCIPVVAGTVCDLSAKVGTLIEAPLTASEPPVVPTTPPAIQPVPTVPEISVLPTTGSSGLPGLLATGFVLLGLGAFALIRRRRPGTA